MNSRKQWYGTVDRHGQITIPAELRKQLGLTPGTRLSFAVKEGAIYLTVVDRRRSTR